MPLCTLQLHSFNHNVTIEDFLSELEKASYPKPILTALPLRWIIRPETFKSPLLNHPWHILLVFTGSPEALPTSVQQLVVASYTLTAGVPSSVLKAYQETNKKLLNLAPGEVPSLTGSLDQPKTKESAQSLELDDDVLTWMKDYTKSNGGGAVSMLNLLAFKPGKEALESYRQYGKRFGESAGSRRGGNAKIVGTVVSDSSQKEWDEIAIAHYPTAKHFADMLASGDYQEINHRYRLPALKDTCILATTEVRLFEDGLGMGNNGTHKSAKL